MLVKTILDEYDLREEFRSMNRDYYSLDGYKALIELFDECDYGTPTELDVIAICCDFSEEDADYIIDSYFSDDKEELFDEDGKLDRDALLDKMNYYTYAIDLGDTILYQNW